MLRRTYAVSWSEEHGETYAGRAEVGRLHVLLSGGRGARLAVPRDDIESVDYVDREVLIRRRRGPSVTIGSLDAPGALYELVELTRDDAAA
jgi:hypothetical protein